MSAFGSRANDAATEVWIDGLRARYSVEAAPPATAALEQIFAWGPHPEPERRPAVAAWLPSRSHGRRGVRIRVATAVLALTLCTGGLAVAGALPTSLQNAIADLAGKVGLDLPHAGTRGGGGIGTGSGSPSADPNLAPGGVPATDPTSATGRSSSATTNVLPGATVPGTGGVPPTVPATTLPPLGGVDLPPISVPGLPVIDVPPITVPPITLPPIELPGLPPITLPPITLPPIGL